MAVDLFSEASPRYSFSHDINHTSLVPAPSELCLSDTGFDFEFGISNSFDQESSSADELFSQGILLPIQIQEKASIPTSKQPIDPLPTAEQKELPLAEDEKVKDAAPSTYLESEEKPQSKPSFWSFKTSTSLSCDSECRKGLLSSLQGLLRSNSTGSVPNPKKPMQNKDKSINPSKHPPLPRSSSTSSSANSSFNQYNWKPPHSKGYYGGSLYGPRGSKTNSVLNVPPPYISNANLFGLDSLFCSGKDKKNQEITLEALHQMTLMSFICFSCCIFLYMKHVTSFGGQHRAGSYKLMVVIFLLPYKSSLLIDLDSSSSYNV